MAIRDNRRRAAAAAGALGALVLIGATSCTPPDEPATGTGGATAASDPPLGPYVPFPAGWGFPQNRSTLQGWVDDVDIADIREWGWTLFAGVNQPAGHDDLTVWQTWWRVTQAFAPAARPGPVGTSAATAPGVLAGSGDGSYYTLANLREIQAIPAAHGRTQGPADLAATATIPHTPSYDSTCGDGTLFANNGDIMIAGEIYNQQAFDHIRDNGYFQQSVLQGLRPASPNATGTSIAAFPNDSIVLKTMYWPVSGVPGDLTALPVWDFDPTWPIDEYNGYETWKRGVAIDPSNSQTGTANVRYLYGLPGEYAGGVTFDAAPIVPIDRFYHRQIDAETLAGMDANDRCILDQSANWAYNRDFQAGDWIALIASHVQSKEIADWAMQTFWWHDQPEEGPHAQNRPTDVPDGNWQNYLMCTAWSMTTPRENNGSPAICANPYIELVVPEPYRITTNCQNCHTRAAWPTQSTANPNGAHYDTSVRGYIPPDADIFDGLVRTDFLWTIADRAIATPASGGDATTD
ncbi:MAG: hypothetical protein GVY28_04205 [Alphaproteobacteria bacterium]|jgi:hypothetical protein|nr:hypothetical protein [Alphaproteobacteria bacterium]